MSCLPEWGQAVVTGVLITVVGALILMIANYIRKRTVRFFSRVNKAFIAIDQIFDKIEEMEVRGDKRRTETALMMEAQLKTFDALEEGKVNGNVKEIRTKLQNYLRDEALSD